MLEILFSIFLVLPFNQAEKSCDTAKKYVELDESYRKYAAEFFRLSEDSSWEKIRPIVAKHYNLRRNASFEEIRERRIKLGELDRKEVEFERKEWAVGLCLTELLSWPEIRKELKKYKK